MKRRGYILSYLRNLKGQDIMITLGFPYVYEKYFIDLGLFAL